MAQMRDIHSSSDTNTCPLDSAHLPCSAASWSVVLAVSKKLVNLGDTLVATAQTSGIDTEGLSFDFAWCCNNRHDEGFAGSTADNARASRNTPDVSQEGPTWTFTPKVAGRYVLSCTVTAPDNTKVSTEAMFTVADRKGFVRPDFPSPCAPIVVDVNDVSMIFNIASEQVNSLKEYFIHLTRRDLFFKEFRALNRISFKVRQGEAFGLVGTNGSGKSTILKIIAGVLQASQGTCKVRGTIAPLIELGAGFDMELTAQENIYLNGALLGYTKEFIDANFDRIVEFAELQDFMEMPLKNYSSGMVARIAFAIATITEPDLLIIDEVLSVGDFLFQKKCEQRIKELVESNEVTVLLVSHSIDLVERVCDRVCWIEKGQQKMLGPTDAVCETYRNYGRAD